MNLGSGYFDIGQSVMVNGQEKIFLNEDLYTALQHDEQSINLMAQIIRNRRRPVFDMPAMPTMAEKVLPERPETYLDGVLIGNVTNVITKIKRPYEMRGTLEPVVSEGLVIQYEPVHYLANTLPEELLALMDKYKISKPIVRGLMKPVAKPVVKTVESFREGMEELPEEEYEEKEEEEELDLPELPDVLPIEKKSQSRGMIDVNAFITAFE
jgi:hypothetical protein